MRGARGPLAWAAFAALLASGCGGDGPSPGMDGGGVSGGEQGPGAPSATGGRLVIVGGALSADNEDVYQAIVQARLGEGPLCVIPTASGDPQASMASAEEALARYVGEEGVTGLLLTGAEPSGADDPAVAQEIRSCSGFYFTGGAQSRVVDLFLPQGDTTQAFRALWDRWQEGAVLAGSSAGAAMMSGVMIASGSSPAAVERGLAGQEDGEGVRIQGGMGFFTQAILDQHFLARGRFGRLLVAVLATDSLPVGLGIDENTALVVDGESARVVGASGVVLLDARGARKAPTTEGAIRGRDVRAWLLGRGDGLDLRSFQVQEAQGRVLVAVDGEGLRVPDDPFARWAFLRLLVEMSASSSSQASFPLAGATLTVREGDGFRAAMEAAEGGVQDTPVGFSAGPLALDLVGEGG